MLIQVYLYYAICIYLLLASFVAIFSDVYRNNTIIKGDPLKKKVERSTGEALWEFGFWLIGWLPKVWVKRLAQMRQDDDEEIGGNNEESSSSDSA